MMDLEGTIVQIDRMKFKVVKEYHSDTFEKDYVLLRELKSKEYYVCQVKEDGYIEEVTSNKEMDMLSIVFEQDVQE